MKTKRKWAIRNGISPSNNLIIPPAGRLQRLHICPLRRNRRTARRRRPHCRLGRRNGCKNLRFHRKIRVRGSVPASPRTAQTQEAKNNPTQGQAQGMENSAAPQKEQRRNTWTNADGSIRPISKWSGVDFTEQQKADYVAGKAVKLENVTDKQGFHATMYIKFNPEKGRPYRYDTNPDNAQKVAPSNESRTQVAVNSEGKTNEATKNLKEPLQKGQTAPKDDKQQKQQEKPQKRNNKGMKM